MKYYNKRELKDKINTRNKFKTIFKYILTPILLIIVLFNLYIIFQKISHPNQIVTIFGYKTYIVSSGSMEPYLQVGDIIHFFTYQIDKNNPVTWRGWHHVVIVGQITDDDIIVYDAGSKFIKSGKYKHSLNEYKNEKGWIAKRFWTLK